MGALLEVRDLTKEYPSFKLDIKTVSLKPGESLGIVGRNGAGKSTFLDLILNQREYDSGTIEIFGLDSKRDEVEIKQSLGFVIDKAGFSEAFKLREAERVLDCIYSNWDRYLYRELLRELQLDSNQTFSELSRGMLVKSQLALALAHHPRFLILDEVTSGLDPVSRFEVLRILKEFMSDGAKSILYATHVTDDLQQLLSNVMFLDRGRPVYVKSVESFEGCSIDEDMVRYHEERYGEL